MKKNILLSVFISMFLFATAQAGSFGLGVSGNMASISADGTETTPTGSETDTSVRSATAGNDFMYGSIFAEYNVGDSERFTLGIDYIPGAADVNRKSISRTDATADANETNQQDGDRTANAEIDKHITYYAELNFDGGLYLKYGFTQVDVNTTESNSLTGTGGSYPNVELDAHTYGVGMKSELGTNGFLKVEGSMTDYDNFSATSTTSNTVSANLDAVTAKIAVGYKF